MKFGVLTRLPPTMGSRQTNMDFVDMLGNLIFECRTKSSSRGIHFNFPTIIYLPLQNENQKTMQLTMTIP